RARRRRAGRDPGRDRHRTPPGWGGVPRRLARRADRARAPRAARRAPRYRGGHAGAPRPGPPGPPPARSGGGPRPGPALVAFAPPASRLRSGARGTPRAPRHRPGGRVTDRTARTPFHFLGCWELREMLGRRAYDERELLEHLEEVPLDSLYFHTHSCFLRERGLPAPYPNDFASWAAIQVRDRVLGEKLGIIDPHDLSDLESLRTEVV